VFSEEFEQFLQSVGILLTIAFAICAFVTPPDPYSQVVAVAVSLPLVLGASYILAYRRGFESR